MAAPAGTATASRNTTTSNAARKLIAWARVPISGGPARNPKYPRVDTVEMADADCCRLSAAAENSVGTTPASPAPSRANPTRAAAGVATARPSANPTRPAGLRPSGNRPGPRARPAGRQTAAPPPWPRRSLRRLRPRRRHRHPGRPGHRPHSNRWRRLRTAGNRTPGLPAVPTPGPVELRPAGRRGTVPVPGQKQAARAETECEEYDGRRHQMDGGADARARGDHSHQRPGQASEAEQRVKPGQDLPAVPTLDLDAVRIYRHVQQAVAETERRQAQGQPAEDR